MACPFMAFKPVLLHSFFRWSMANQTVIEGCCLCSQSPSPTAASLPCRSFGFNPMWPMGALPCSCCSSAKRSKTLLSPFPLSTINVCKTCFVVWLIHQIVSLCGWHLILISKLKGRLSQPACLVAFSIPDLMCKSAAQTVFPRTQMGLCIFWKHQHAGRS